MRGQRRLLIYLMVYNMTESKSQKIPPFTSFDELIEFFDTQDMGDYLDELPEVHFDVDIKVRTHLNTGEFYLSRYSSTSE
jgi:hypothetical protein